MIQAVAIFFVSGFAALLYEVVFAKTLALTFGSMAAASTTVLATYMAGMALGSWLGGAVARRMRDGVRAYAACELAIAVVCSIAPWTLAALRTLYVAIAHGSDPSAAWLLPLRVTIGAAALLPPTILMGMTLPFLVRALTTDTRTLGRVVGSLYSANTLGAAAGALAAGYLLLPAFGVTTAIRMAVSLNLIAAVASLRLRPRIAVAEAVAESEAPVAADSSRALLGLAVLAVGGVITLALEIAYVHLLAVVAGNSAYAFSLMLFAFLVGLGAGSAAARRLPASDRLASVVAILESALAAAVLGGVFLWDRMPALFELAGTWTWTRSFAGRELVRFVACCVALVPPAACIGALYPVAMACVGRGSRRDPARTAGEAAALNTIGNVVGALLCGFVLLPRLGSLRTVQLLASTAMTMGVVAAATSRRRGKSWIAVGVAAALLLAQPRAFDLRRLASGSNVYFEPDRIDGTVVGHAESLDGGLTTVVRSRGGGRVTLRTNGKFEGDNSGEMRAQVAFALDALLHAAGRDRALIIGFGTGATTSAVQRAGFAHVDVAELSADILALADRYFRTVNHGVLHAPEVVTHVTDGRNYLLLTPDRYDLIAIELSSIWFAGAASLYNREFYASARAHLAPAGVLQQWMQLHHIRPEDIVSILATVRAEFPKVWLYVTGGQGIIIACVDGCEPRRETLDRLRASSLVVDAERVGGLGGLLQTRLLDPTSIDRLLAATGEPGAPMLISTDDNLRLEYATPRGNVLTTPIVDIVRSLYRFAPSSPLAGTRLDEADLSTPAPQR